jgi:hypothetical protein
VPLWRIAGLFGWPSAFSVQDPDAASAWLADAAERLGSAEHALHETLGSDIASLFQPPERT